MKNIKKKLMLQDIVFRDCIIKPKDITDNIINSIKELDYKGLSCEQSKQLTMVIKEVLREVKKDGDNKEIALVYDLNGFINQKGEWLLKTSGRSENDFIDLAQDTDINHIITDEADRAIVISHNHPNNRIISLLDLRTFAIFNNIRIIVAVTNSGKISYILKDNFNFNKYIDLSKQIINNKNDITNDELLIELLNNSSSYGMIFFKEDYNG